ncbi:MAG: TonB-dependent receptor plug [Akkermansiaceae bacterium]|nr:TonB-dependent receptor plug [Akkermansiaceae bacterium]
MLPRTVLLLTACTVLPLAAQDLDRGISESLPEMVITGKAENVLGKSDSASKGQASREELLRRPWLRRGELLETVPGLVVTQHSGDGKANQYFVRGYNLDHGTDSASSPALISPSTPRRSSGSIALTASSGTGSSTTGKASPRFETFPPLSALTRQIQIIDSPCHPTPLETRPPPFALLPPPFLATASLMP